MAQLQEIVLQPEQFVDGYIYKNTADEPVAYASIQLYEDGNQWASYYTRTDGNGYFKVRGLKSGTYKAEIYAYNLPSKTETVEAGESMVVFLNENLNGAFAGEGNAFAASKTSTVPGDTIEYRLNYKNHGHTTQDVDVHFSIPEEVEITSESLLPTRQNVDSSEFASQRSLTLRQVTPKETGTISFKARVKEDAEKNLTSTATMIAGEEEVHLNNHVSLNFVTLHGPEVTADETVKVYGSVKPGSQIKIYDGEQLLKEITSPSHSRWWYADITLPVFEDSNSTHQLIAKVTKMNKLHLSTIKN